MKKTWIQKLEDKKSLPKILKLEKRFPCYNTMHKMGADVGDDIILVNPSEVVEMMKKVPEGKLATIVEICKSIAKNHQVKGCCSLTTGIFIMTIANAVEEFISKGEKSSFTEIPYWRTLKTDGFLNEKYPGGLEAHKILLQKESFQVTASGKKYQVVNFDKYLIKI